MTDTVEYTYGNAYWSDRLTAINVNGTSKNISYATYLNPSSWYNGTQFTNLTWTQGRRLSSITKGSQTYSYEYDMAGARTSKVANGLRHEYVTQNGRIVREIVTNASTGAFQYALDFTYDEAGHPLTMRKYNNADMQSNYVTMQYVCNAQGDVVKLIYNGTVYAEYTYDAWGNVLTATENGSYNYAALNPLRYRGYYYDSETGFYYLQSRYYDPTLGRFLNADGYASTGQGFLGYNMFAYCGNNPVSSSDPSGEYGGHQPIMVCDNGGPVTVKTDITMEQAVRDINNAHEFSVEVWNELEPDNRWGFIDNYAEKVENAMGLDPIEIRGFFGNSETVGYYVHSERALYLSRILLYDRDQAMATVRHELRHYYQNTLCDALPRNYSCIFTGIIIEWDINRQPGNYISDGPGYITQPMEKDAFDWESKTG